MQGDNSFEAGNCTGPLGPLDASRDSVREGKQAKTCGGHLFLKAHRQKTKEKKKDK